MNVRSAAARLSAPMSALVEPQAHAGADLTARRARDIRRRRLIVFGLQLLVAVAWLGSWELTTRLRWVAECFVAQPSGNARILGAGSRQLTTEIIVPSALSWITASLHTSFGLALVGAVVGELFGATSGVGELIYSAKNNFDADGVFAGMALLAAIALVAEALITALENRLVRWRPQVSTETRI